jgi:hypothetical protein
MTNGVCSNVIVSHGATIPACLLVNFAHYTTILPNSVWVLTEELCFLFCTTWRQISFDYDIMYLTRYSVPAKSIVVNRVKCLVFTSIKFIGKTRI